MLKKNSQKIQNITFSNANSPRRIAYMRIIKFPYTLHRGISLPYIPISLKIGNQWRRFWTFVDSGSTFSIFKVSEITDLDFDFKTGKLFNVQVGDGGFIPIYVHKLELNLD